MKNIFKIITLLFAMAFVMPCEAKNDEEITLIVTSDGTNKDEAIKNTLRTAIEQAYGVFVSANTDILSDELIKDEIVTISSGNIKKFEEIAVVNESDKVITTLKIIVSKGKLLSYAKSKGSECELDGDAIFADIQLQELYKHNEEKLFENLCAELEHLFLNGYDYKVNVKRADKSYTGYIGSSYGSYNPNHDPDNNVCFECDIFVKLNEQGELAWKKLISTLKDVGQSYNPNKFRLFSDGNGQQDFTEELSLIKPTRFLIDGAYYERDNFKVRSRKTCYLVENLIDKLPRITKNIMIEYGEKQIDISKDLSDLEEDRYGGTPSCLISTRPYSRKKGSNCGEYRYFLNVPKEDLKGVKAISVKANDTFKF